MATTASHPRAATLASHAGRAPAAEYSLVVGKHALPTTWGAFRSRMRFLVALNLATVAAVILVQLQFTSIRATTHPAALWLLVAGACAQAAELIWLYTPMPPPAPRVARVHANASLACNLLLALAIAALSPVGDVLYNLLILP